MKDPRLLVALIYLLACGVSACGEDEVPEIAGSSWGVRVETVDGVRRMVNTPPESGPQPTLVAEEELRVGTAEGLGPASFGLIRELAVLPNGRFAVADGQAQEVRLFDPDGRHLRTFGGEGAGPGELSGMQGVQVGPDGMLRVPEALNARLTVFHPDSGFVTTFPFRLYTSSGAGPWAAAVDSAGRTLVASSGQYGEGRFWEMVRVYDAAMRQIDSIPYREYTDLARRALEGDDDDFPGAWRIDLGNGGWTFAQVPFYSRPHEVLTPTGEFWSTAEGQVELEIARWTPSGDTTLILTSLRPSEPVTPSERDSAMTELRAQLSERVPNLPNLDASRVPATKPPLHGLSLDDDGRLWVRLTDPTTDSTVYDVFSGEGRHAETVRLPFRVDRFVSPVVRGDSLWAVVADDLDVQYVIRAVLRLPPDQSP